MTATDFRSWGESGQQLGDQVIYYRRPNKGEQAGWIVWADSVSGTKLRDMVKRGFTPMFEFGVINSPENRRRFGDGQSDSWMTEPGAPWKPILSHPDGPAAFPAAQVTSMRWYRPEECPVPEARFPQLQGETIREYRCPQCRSHAPFVDIEGAGGVSALANHLAIIHKWDRTSLNAYGDRTGIDFNKVDVVDMKPQEIEAPQDPPPPPSPVTIEEIGSDTDAVAILSCECGWSSRPDSKSPEASLQTHKNLHCPLREKVTA